MNENDGDSDDLDELVEDLLGPEWVQEDRPEQLAELLRRHGDPHRFYNRLGEFLDDHSRE